MVHGDCVQYWLHVSRLVRTVVGGGARAHEQLTGPACTIIGVGPLRLYTLLLWAWAMDYGPWGARITHGALELASYFRHECPEYPVNIRFGLN